LIYQQRNNLLTINTKKRHSFESSSIFWSEIFHNANISINIVLSRSPVRIVVTERRKKIIFAKSRAGISTQDSGAPVRNPRLSVLLSIAQRTHLSSPSASCVTVCALEILFEGLLFNATYESFLLSMQKKIFLNSLWLNLFLFKRNVDAGSGSQSGEVAEAMVQSSITSWTSTTLETTTRVGTTCPKITTNRK